MSELLTLVGLGLALFVSTNLDDIFILLGFFADRRYQRWQIVLGQYLGMGALVALSLGGAFAAVAIPAKYIGLLGAFPFLIGVKNLVSAFRGEPAQKEPSAAPSVSSVASVALVTLANGGDNIAAYVPVFATRKAHELAVILVCFAVMTGVWCAAGSFLVNHRTLGAPIRRYGQILLPWVLMALGISIFASSRSAAGLRPSVDSDAPNQTVTAPIGNPTEG
ncbi:cadmium resistance transporter [Pendulispora rubella]|uniref:Cadmium resistance transporter n=1 Tax=Pendulispora rubella TaxID=2741070 RepID=A0ABZ2KWG9_9BACT